MAVASAAVIAIRANGHCQIALIASRKHSLAGLTVPSAAPVQVSAWQDADRVQPDAARLQCAPVPVRNQMRHRAFGPRHPQFAIMPLRPFHWREAPPHGLARHRPAHKGNGRSWPRVAVLRLVHRRLHPPRHAAKAQIANPANQPAVTSLGQCTPRKTRVTPASAARRACPCECRGNGMPITASSAKVATTPSVCERWGKLR